MVHHRSQTQYRISSSFCKSYMTGGVGRGHNLLLPRLARAGPRGLWASGPAGPHLHHLGLGAQHLVPQAHRLPQHHQAQQRGGGQDPFRRRQIRLLAGTVPGYPIFMFAIRESITRILDLRVLLLSEASYFWLCHWLSPKFKFTIKTGFDILIR